MSCDGAQLVLDIDSGTRPTLTTGLGPHLASRSLSVPSLVPLLRTLCALLTASRDHSSRRVCVKSKLCCSVVIRGPPAERSTERSTASPTCFHLSSATMDMCTECSVALLLASWYRSRTSWNPSTSAPPLTRRTSTATDMRTRRDLRAQSASFRHRCWLGFVGAGGA